MILSTRIISALFLSFLLILSCSSDKGTTPDEPDPDTPPEFDYYVDGLVGENTNPGTEDLPLKTITFALTKAVPGDSIKVSPATYNSSIGEIFPIQIPDSVYLIGNEERKGAGVFPTAIQGVGLVSGSYYATVVSGQGSRLSGFSVLLQNTDPFRYAVYVEDDGFALENCTVNGLWGGIILAGSGDLIVRNNNISGNQLGLVNNCSGSVLIEANNFLSGADILTTTGSPSIRKNIFTGNAYTALSIQQGSSLIDSNIFDGYYTYGALRLESSAAPSLRSNTFNVHLGTSVLIEDNAIPDLGTALDSGYNVFASDSGYAIRHESPERIFAIGNTWHSSTPQCGSEIKVTGDGSIIWGTGAGDSCYLDFTGEFEADDATVALWHLNEGVSNLVVDASGNGHNGTLGPSVVAEKYDPTWVAMSRFNAGLSFNAADSEFVLAGSFEDDFSTNQFTIEIWVKTTATNAILFATDDAIILEIFSGGIYLSIGDGSGSNWKDVSDLIHPVNNGAWHYIVCTFSGEALEIFLDGESVGSNLDAAITLGTLEGYYIGGFTLGNYFTGELDEIRISDEVRSAAEIADYYNLAKDFR